MSEQTPEEIISVVRAFMDGKKIECRKHYCFTWQETSRPSWNFNQYLYRVKDEPVVCYAVGEYVFFCEEIAKKRAKLESLQVKRLVEDPSYESE